MKKFLAITAFLNVTSCYSMEKLSDKHNDEIENRIKQLEFAMNNESFFAGREESRRFFINDQIIIIEKILDENSIKHPQQKNMTWLNTLKNEIMSKKKPAVDELAIETCNIAGLDKADILKALFEAAKGNYYPSAKECPSKDKLNILLKEQSYNIDYMYGKPLKVNLEGDTFDTYLYNRDNGAGAAQNAIKQLRKKLSPN